MAPPFAQQTKKTTTQSSTSGGPPGLTSSRTAGPPAPPGKSRDQIAKELDREITRRTYFDGRQDVSDDRLDRRLVQAQEEKDFISTLKPVEGTGGTLLQEQAPVFNPRTGRYERTTLADKRIQLANKYGPTFGELASDMGYAFGSMAKGAGDILQSGRFGIIGILKDVANYAFNKTNEDYDKLNDVEKEVFENPNKYPYASKMPRIGALDSTRQLMLEAERDALGLELDTLMAEREFRYNNPTVDMRKPTVEGLAGIDIPADDYVESGQFKKDLQQSGIITIDDPKTQEAITDETKIPGENATIGDLKKVLKDRGFNDFQIQQTVDQVTQQIISGEYTGDVEVDTGSTTDDQVSFTPYNNPFNLEFRGQEGAEPGYGSSDDPDRFAKFANLDTGIKAGVSRVADIVGEGKSTDDFLNIYAPRSDNQESYDNYLSVLQDKVGPTIEPDEIKPLTEGIVKFENKPELADQYLNYLEQEKDKLYSGIVS